MPTDPQHALGPGQIRIQVRAAGLNFRDVVVALGAIADEGLGGEAAGVIIDTAADVTSLRPGDAVMGLFPHNAFAPTAITDQRMVVPIPAGWSFTQAASVPVAFLTAYIALVEMAGLSAGQRVLIHAGAGGVGQAAIQIARHLGAEVFATAHPNKHRVLQRSGSRPRAHRLLAHPGFRRGLPRRHRRAGHGRGAQQPERRVHRRLAGTAAPRRQFHRDRQDRHPPARRHRRNPPRGRLSGLRPGQRTAGSAQPAWTALTELFAAGVLQPLPTTSYGLLAPRQAFRDMSQARHTGKIVLIPPRCWIPRARC